jgi:uncharacterized membrane-anchored protein
VIKVAATTLGETGGDSVTMTLNWGYLTGTVIFIGLLVVLVIAQILAKNFHPVLYWATIVASTTFGTTMADFADRSLGIGYTGGSTLLLVCVVVAALSSKVFAISAWVVLTFRTRTCCGSKVFAISAWVLTFRTRTCCAIVRGAA